MNCTKGSFAIKNSHCLLYLAYMDLSAIKNYLVSKQHTEVGFLNVSLFFKDSFE